MYRLDSQSLWVDEVYSMELSVGRGYEHLRLPINTALIEHPPDLTTLAAADPWYTILANQEHDPHPPLFFVTLRLWRGLWIAVAGVDSDVSARMLSVIVSVWIVWLTYRLVLLLSVDGDDRSARISATWAAAICALSSIQIMYAQEVRGYAMATAFAMAGAVAIVRLTRDDVPFSWPRAMAGTALLGAAALTHYFATGAVAATMAYVVFTMKRGARRNRLAGVMIAGLALMAGLWCTSLLTQARNVAENAGTLWLTTGASGVRDAALRLAALPLTLLAPPPNGFELAARLFGIVLAAMTVVALIRHRGRVPKLIGFPTMWIVGTFGLLTAIDLALSSQHLQISTYAIVAGPMVGCLVVGLAGELRQARWLAQAALAAVVFYCAASVPMIAYREKEPWRQTVRFVERKAKAGDATIIVSYNPTLGWGGSPAMVYLCARHAAASCGLDALPGASEVLLTDHPVDVSQVTGWDRIAQRPHRIWVWSAWGGISPLRILPGYQAIDQYSFPEIGGGVVLMEPTSKPANQYDGIRPPTSR
jgi:hypothetical protein